MAYIDKPRFHKPTHPARAKPRPADTLMEPSGDVPRLALLRSAAVPADAPPLQSHAQAGVELQERAEHSPEEREMQRREQLAWLERAKSALRKEIPLLGVRVPARACGALAAHPAVKEHVFRSPRTKHIRPDPDGDASFRSLQLGVQNAEQLDDAAQAAIREAGGELVPLPVVLDWDYWSVDQILRAVLPDELEEGAPSAFSVVGHLVHVNLREEYLAYRYLIGQVILDKTPRARTVVNKLDTIDSEFRVFAMELLAGEPEYHAEVSESGCLFQLDFRSVYWNSRLHTEHARLIDQFQPFQVVADVMAGIGPFAVPAGKKRCYVLANDLNPSCYESLKGNTERNHVATRVAPYCMDGRAFIQEAVQRCWDAAYPGAVPGSELQSAWQRRKAVRQRAAGDREPPAPPARRSRRLVDHFVMNLPASALEFLDAYRGAYTRLAQRVGREAVLAEIHARAQDRGDGDAVEPLPMVHVHCFTKEIEAAAPDICKRASAALGLPAHEALVPPGERNATPDLSLHLVRSVAPNKDMYCLSFRLPASVLFADA